ncbi:MAG: sugar O-acetyltransferase [Rhodobacteraceae bacterium]|nr:sugar O-acetyltransferase [Paracoccaceae bacterium]
MSTEKSAFDRLLAGERVVGPDPQLNQLQADCAVRIAAYNSVDPSDMEALGKAAQIVFGKVGYPSLVKQPIMADYGINVEIGSRSFINFNCTFLDCNKIIIGDCVAIGPNVQLITASHPVKFEERYLEWPEDKEFPFRAVTHARPITIEDQCWLGAGVIVLPGVTIGKASVIGAGSVVTKDIPAGVVAVGNPCRVLRKI